VEFDRYESSDWTNMNKGAHTKAPGILHDACMVMEDPGIWLGVLDFIEKAKPLVKRKKQKDYRLYPSILA
jgi:hypothetical protein